MPLPRALVALALLVAACGSPQKPPPAAGSDDASADDGSGAPTTAAQKAHREARASGESDGGRWSGWRYQGDRDDCFFVIGRRCFKTEAAACRAARCATPEACRITGGGPAAVSCDAAP